MKYAKTAVLTALVASASVLFVSIGTASATELLCAGAVVCKTGTPIAAKSENKVKLTFAGVTEECEVEVGAKTTNEGAAAETVKGKVEILNFLNCTVGVVAVPAKGTVEIHTEGANTNNNGTLTSTGTELTVEASGLHCIFATNATDLGTITGSANTGGEATIDLNAAIPRTGGRSGAFCGANGTFTGSYKISEPNPLNVR